MKPDRALLVVLSARTLGLGSHSRRLREIFCFAQQGMHMKKTMIVLAAFGALSLAACGHKTDAADNVVSAADNTADSMEATADNVRDEASNAGAATESKMDNKADAIDNKADAVRAAGENKADAMDNMTDAKKK
jgi:hypothetical protein